MKPQSRPQPVETGRYTQINILFPSSEVELPPADKYKSFPEEAQREILEGFRREQTERHVWLKTQQKNDHELNLLAQKNYFIWRLCGTIIGGFLAIMTIALGAWLVSKGASGAGVGMMLVAAAVVIGSAIYGHKASSGAAKQEENDKMG